MLSPRALSRLQQLQLSSRRRLAGSLAGEHRSPRYGETLDFADFREYYPGDDFRRIDPHVLARLDLLRVKLFEADDDLVVRVLLDTSASMVMHDKHRAAAAVVAGLGAVALTAGDSYLVSAFPSREMPRRFRGRNSVPVLVDYLQRLPLGGTTPFVKAARVALALRGPPGMTVVVSDLLTPEWPDAIRRLPARGCDLLVVHVLAAEETDPDLLGDLSLIDEETTERVPVSLSPDRLEEYRHRVNRWTAEVQQRCHDVGGRYLSLDASDDVEATLLSSWRKAGVLR